MSDFENYSKQLLLSSKKFLEDAKAHSNNEPDFQRFLRASLTHAFFFLEAQLNYLAHHFSNSKDFDLIERALLSEMEVRLDKGQFRITDKPKFYSMEDRIEFLLRRFSSDIDAAKGTWFSALKDSIGVRNRLVHPKDAHEINIQEAEKAIISILDCLSSLYKSIFQKEFPLKSLGLHTGPINKN